VYYKVRNVLHFGTEIAIVSCMMEKDKKENKKINYDRTIIARITSPTYMMLEEISQDEKIKITELVREAVKEYIINKIGA
jgi:hypothetical protein